MVNGHKIPLCLNASKTFAAMTPETLKRLAQRAFALAVNEACPGVVPNADQVKFTPHTLFHSCRYETEGGLIFNGSFYYCEGWEAGGTVCIGMVEDRHGAYLHLDLWHHFFDVVGEYNTMQGAEIRRWSSDQNSRHMRQSHQLEYLFECLFRGDQILPDGTTYEEVSIMTQFEKIERLERLYEDMEMFGDPMLNDIGAFLDVVEKENFRTANDFEIVP